MACRYDKRAIGAAPRSPLEQDLEALAYRHLMHDDPGQAQRSIADVKAAVTEWSAGPALGRTVVDRGPVLASARHATAIPAPAPDRSLGIDL